jgi:hypothetical protein
VPQIRGIIRSWGAHVLVLTRGLLPKTTNFGGATIERQSIDVRTNVENAREGAEAEYEYTIGDGSSKLGVPIHCFIVNYNSVEAAEAAIREAAQRDNETLKPKSAHAGLPGYRYSGKGSGGKDFVVWSDGSLVCQINGAGIQALENFEEAMPF